MPGHEARLKEAAGPLSAYLHEVEEDIRKHEQLLSELRDYRRRLQTVVRQLDPESIKVVAQTNGKKKPPKTSQVSEQTVQEVSAYVRGRSSNLNEQGFSVRDLVADSQNPLLTMPQMSEASIRATLTVLHERGALVLDRVENGGRKVYKVVV